MENPGKFDVDLALLQKYNQPGPRYTSYPTAPQFHSGFQGGNYEEAIAVSNRENPEGELSLYFHLPFCHSLCYFCGCNMIVTRNAGRVERYLTYLRKEIDLVSKQINPRREVVQLHWGGGTPTYLSPTQIREIFGYIREHFNLAKDAEISIEIDPRRLAPDHLSTLREVGFNRVSFGVQDFHPEVQQAINRIQSDEQNRYVIEIHRKRLGPEQFLSLDLDRFEFSGLMVDMRVRSMEAEAPISHVIVEVNAAQRWLLQQPHIQRWMQTTGVIFVPHTTSVNKADPKFGVESVGDFFRQGKIRIPSKGPASKRRAEPLVTELLAYPDGDTDDLVMSTWFHTLAVNNHYSPRQARLYRQQRPSWVSSGRGLAWAR